MEAHDKNTYNPGWNDPPTFTYDQAKATEMTSGRKSLNKRVAFPMSGNVGKGNSSIDPTMPPLPFDASKIPPPPPCMLPMRHQSDYEPSENVPLQHDLEDNTRLSRVLENLEPIAKDKADDEISKRIRVMEKMWLENKLHIDVQAKLYELSEALSKGDVDSADNIQKGLMVDYISQCSPWMGAVRHLINHKRNDKSV